MKTKLPERSLRVEAKLKFIVNEILSVAKNKVSKIILFGSYARGNWVNDIYFENHITYTYQSDLDILLILKNGKFRALKLEYNIAKRLKKKQLEDNPWVTLITEPLARVNKELEKGQYFFTDIKKEGILLYDDGEPLSDKKDLSNEELRKIAKDDYDAWFDRGAGFLFYSVTALERDEYNFSAFFLHQATESFYNAILLVFTGYKPKLHDITKLRAMVNNYHEDLLKIFHFDTPEQVKCYELLRDAYIDARYDKNYNISEEQLRYLIERVEKLKNVTENICLNRIYED